MSKLHEILDRLVETVYNPTPQDNPYLQTQAKADIKRLIEEDLIWGGKGGEPYPNDADFIRDEQMKRLAEL